MNYIIAIGVFQALVAVVLLCAKEQRNKADSLLVLLILCIGTHLAIKFCIYTLINDAQAKNQLNTFIGLSYGPLLYLYARKKQDDNFIPISCWYVFVPLFVGAIAYSTVVCTLWLDAPVGYKLLHIYNNFSTYIMIGYNLLFSVLSFRIMKGYEASLAPEKKLLAQLVYCFFAFSFISTMLLLFTAQFNINLVSNYLARTIIYSILILVCVFILRYKFRTRTAVANVVVQNEMLSEDVLPENIVIIEEQLFVEPSPIDIDALLQSNEERKERRVQLSADKHKEIIKQMDSCLLKTKLYREPEISLDMLAKSVGLNKHHISEALNVHANKSFYQYINEYRIEEVTNKIKQLTEKDVSVNVLSLAYGCGFKAKSSFNQHFKKITGITPSEYTKAIKMNLQKA
jgi:AraC-like DNA-binding protein